MERDGQRLFDVQLDSPKGSYDVTARPLVGACVDEITGRAIRLQLDVQGLGLETGRSIHGESVSVNMTFNLKHRTRFPLTHCRHVPRVAGNCKKLKHRPLSEKKKKKKEKKRKEKKRHALKDVLGRSLIRVSLTG